MRRSLCYPMILCLLVTSVPRDEVCAAVELRLVIGSSWQDIRRFSESALMLRALGFSHQPEKGTPIFGRLAQDNAAVVMEMRQRGGSRTAHSSSSVEPAHKPSKPKRPIRWTRIAVFSVLGVGAVGGAVTFLKEHQAAEVRFHPVVDAEPNVELYLEASGAQRLRQSMTTSFPELIGLVMDDQTLSSKDRAAIKAFAQIFAKHIYLTYSLNPRERAFSLQAVPIRALDGTERIDRAAIVNVPQWLELTKLADLAAFKNSLITAGQMVESADPEAAFAFLAHTLQTLRAEGDPALPAVEAFDRATRTKGLRFTTQGIGMAATGFEPSFDQSRNIQAHPYIDMDATFSRVFRQALDMPAQTSSNSLFAKVLRELLIKEGFHARRYFENRSQEFMLVGARSDQLRKDLEGVPDAERMQERFLKEARAIATLQTVDEADGYEAVVADCRRLGIAAGEVEALETQWGPRSSIGLLAGRIASLLRLTEGTSGRELTRRIRQDVLVTETRNAHRHVTDLLFKWAVNHGYLQSEQEPLEADFGRRNAPWLDFLMAPSNDPVPGRTHSQLFRIPLPTRSDRVLPRTLFIFSVDRQRAHLARRAA